MQFGDDDSFESIVSYGVGGRCGRSGGAFVLFDTLPATKYPIAEVGFQVRSAPLRQLRNIDTKHDKPCKQRPTCLVPKCMFSYPQVNSRTAFLWISFLTCLFSHCQQPRQLDYLSFSFFLHALQSFGILLEKRHGKLSIQ